MGHFAHISNIEPFYLTISGIQLSGYRGIVDNVIRAEQDFIDSRAVGDPTYWIQTSYNNNIRNVYAGKDYYYESIRDIFYPPAPYPSWLLIEHVVGQWVWRPPVPYPSGGNLYFWDESIINWKAVSAMSATI